MQQSIRHWRETAGFFSPGKNSLQTILAYFSYFLADRSSAELFGSKELNDIPFQWGKHPLLEKIVHSQDDLELLIQNPHLSKNSLAIIEPWENVGTNPRKEGVRASKNVAYIAQKSGDMDSVLLPLWKNFHLLSAKSIKDLVSNSLIYIVEGGASSVYDDKSFSPSCSKDDLLSLIEELLLNRLEGSLGLFICLGHQLASEAHIRLIKRAVKEILALKHLDGDSSNEILNSLQELAKKIIAVGEKIHVVLQDGSCPAKNWNDPHFCTTKNVRVELRGHRLSNYAVPSSQLLNVPSEVIETYEMTAQNEGLIDLMERYSDEISIDMFHGDIATEQAAIFASWAYTKLHTKLVGYRHVIANSSLYWLLSLPFAIKILASTRLGESVITANAATCIFYKDFDTGQLKRNFTTQFHPELLDDLRDFGYRGLPAYQEMKRNPGIRMLIHLFQTLINNK